MIFSKRILSEVNNIEEEIRKEWGLEGKNRKARTV
jgi:hypothetical protein